MTDPPPSHPLDAWPVRTRAGDVMSAGPEFVDAGCPLGNAAAAMAKRRISSVLVDAAGLAGGPGILTERDVVRALAHHGPAAHGLACASLMSTPLVTVGAGDPLHVAIARMTGLDIRHLPVRNASGELCGILTSRFLARRRTGPDLSLRDELGRAGGAADLARVRERLAATAGALVEAGESAPRIAGVIAGFYRGLSRRAAELAEARTGDGAGGYGFVILGSAGRGESLLAGDQDNAIVCAPEADDARLERIAGTASDLLDAAGLPYCKGGVMASRSEWRRTIGDWERQIARWVRRTDGASLLNVDIFFDLAHVHGDRALVDRLRTLALERARAPVLPRMMAEQLQTWRSPLGLLGSLRTRDGRLDLKLGGLFPLVAGARAMALRHGIEATATADRLAALRDSGVIGEGDARAFAEAHGTFLDLLLRQQLRDLKTGRAAGPAIDPQDLTSRQLRRLRRGLRDVARMPGLVLDVTASG